MRFAEAVPAIYSGSVMRKVFVLALTLLILLVGLPLAMGMGDMSSCPTCGVGDAAVAIAMCLAVLSLFVLNISTTSRTIPGAHLRLRVLLVGDPPEKPPRSLR